MSAADDASVASDKESVIILMHDFGNTPVYFNSCGIANVLSLYRLGRKFRVTYDSSDCDVVFQVHTKQGIVEFKPTPKGLHALNLKDIPEAAFLLVNDADIQMPHVDHNQMHVHIIWENFDAFSCKQVEGAMARRRLMGMVATPSQSDFEEMVRLNMLKDCPVTNDNIKMLIGYLARTLLQSGARRFGAALNGSLQIM